MADDPQITDLKSSLAAAESDQQSAQAGMQSAISDFNPPENQASPTFDTPQPQDHWNNIVGLSPLLVALGAIGGKLGHAHGIAMLQSTNAMMKGMVQGSAEQYADARKQYETKYEQWRDQQKTWNDTYKAYMQAYKGRIDAQQRALAGANAAVGIKEKDLAMGEKQVEDAKKLGFQITKEHDKVVKDAADEASKRIQADSAAARAVTAEKEAAIKLEDLKLKTKTADANTLTATARTLKEQADSILKQYPASGGKRPAEITEKLKGLRDQMDVVTEKLTEHTQANYNANKAQYDEARQAIKSGADPSAVKARLAKAGLSPDAL